MNFSVLSDDCCFRGLCDTLNVNTVSLFTASRKSKQRRIQIRKIYKQGKAGVPQKVNQRRYIEIHRLLTPLLQGCDYKEEEDSQDRIQFLKYKK